MKVQYEYDGYPRILNFSVEESSNGFLCTLKTTKDIQKMEEIKGSSSDKNIIEIALKKYIEDKTQLPLLFDNEYAGGGYNFKIRMDLLIRKL